MEFQILGPLEVRAHGSLVPLTGGRQRRLLAVMLLNAERPVSLHTLIDAVWEEHPPATAKRQIQNSLWALRRLLAAGTGGAAGPTILAEYGGYRLHLAAATLDATVFQGRVDTAHQLLLAGQRKEAADELKAALDLWRDRALADLTGPVIEPAATSLNERRRAAAAEWVDLELELGHHADLVGELTRLVAIFPFQERFVEQLMLALHRCGRQPDALAAYRDFRTGLVDSLGLEPGARLQRLHTDLLASTGPASTGPAGTDSAGADLAGAGLAGTGLAGADLAGAGLAGAGLAGTGPAVAERAVAVPRQLPADIAAFAGRVRELTTLERLYPRGAATICAITGAAGVGKTTLAIHWGHRIRTHFPDGQLYVNLRGFDPAGAPLDPGEVLRGFLEALGTPPERIPVDLPGRSALYRSLLADRRVLVVLDNARDAGQLRWMLPGGPRCLVLATSRDRLVGLVAAECAHPVNLDLLPPAEARQMLAARLGTERLTAEPEAVDEIIERCARLPLAIAVTAARVATHPNFSLGVIAGGLRAARTALDAFAGNDPTTDVRAVSSWSYQELSAPAKRLFRLLGLHPGPDVTAAAAASLTAVREDDARSVLAELRDANLIMEHTPDRYSCHDLLRAYATELVGSTEPETERRAALRRLLDHYLHSAYAADRLLDRFRDPIDTPPPCPGAVVARIADHEDAMDWFGAELGGLLRALDRAAAAGFDGHTWRLAWALAYFLERRGHWQPWAAAHRTALAAASRSGDRIGQAHAHRSLGRAHVHLGGLDEATDHLRQAHDLFRDSGDVAGHARIHFDLCWIATRQHDRPRSLEHAQQALELFQATPNRSGQARALNNVAWGYHDLGDHRQALAFGRRALALNQATGDRFGEADSWAVLGQSRLALGQSRPALGQSRPALGQSRPALGQSRPALGQSIPALGQPRLALGHDGDAVHCCRRAVELYRELGHRWAEADCLIRLGDAYRAGGAERDAAEAWRRAATVLEDLGHPDADVAWGRLRAGAPVRPSHDDPPHADPPPAG